MTMKSDPGMCCHHVVMCCGNKLSPQVSGSGDDDIKERCRKSMMGEVEAVYVTAVVETYV